MGQGKGVFMQWCDYEVVPIETDNVQRMFVSGVTTGAVEVFGK